MVESRNAQLVTPPTRVEVELAASAVCEPFTVTRRGGRTRSICRDPRIPKHSLPWAGAHSPAIPWAGAHSPAYSRIHVIGPKPNILGNDHPQ